MEDHEREQPPTKPPLKEDELELSLGLRPAAAVEKAKVDAPEGSGELSLRVPVWRKLSSEFDCEFSGLELEAKREEQTMRRREARRKREEKRKLKAGGEDKKRRRKASFLVSGMPCYNYMMMPGLVGSDAGGLRVAGGAGFRPYVVADGVKLSGSGCSRASSPGGSDHRSTSQGGSSSEGGSHSSHSHILDQTTANGPTMSKGKGEASSSSQQIEPTQTLKTTPNTESCNITTNSEVQTEASPSKKPSPTHTSEANRVPLASKPPKPPAQQTNEASLLSQMPYVSTTGNGPNGKTITGFLYKYNQSEVCIVCVCHGSSLTPAGFVEHAGGVDVENPLRHITVVPFAFT